MKQRLQPIMGLFLVCYWPIASAANDSEITSILTKFVELLQSNIARCLAVLAIVAVGYGTVYLGRIPKERAASVVIGICIIFGAKFILQKLGYGVV